MLGALVVACVLKTAATAFALHFLYTTLAENSVRGLCARGYGSDLMCGFNGRSMMVEVRFDSILFPEFPKNLVQNQTE